MRYNQRHGFTLDTPITMAEFSTLRTMERYPELASQADWDNLVVLMEGTVGSFISQTRHKLIEKYSEILERHNLINE